MDRIPLISSDHESKYRGWWSHVKPYSPQFWQLSRDCTPSVVSNGTQWYPQCIHWHPHRNRCKSFGPKRNYSALAICLIQTMAQPQQEWRALSSGGGNMYRELPTKQMIEDQSFGDSWFLKYLKCCWRQWSAWTLLEVTRQHWEQLLETYDHSITNILDVLLEEARGTFTLRNVDSAKKGEARGKTSPEMHRNVTII